MRLHEDGDADAAHVAALLFERGSSDIQQDLAQAEEWYERAVTRNTDPYIRYDLARVIIRRHHLAKQEPERLRRALEILENLTQEHNAHAALYLGAIHLDGTIVTRSLDRAEYFSRMADEQGFPFALLLLSNIEFQRHHYFRGVYLRFRAALRALVIFCRKANDPRLAFMHKGVNINEFPALHNPDTWYRFS